MAADPLYEVLSPHFDQPDLDTRPIIAPLQNDATTRNYLTRLTTLSLQSLSTTEPAALSQASHSVLRSLQALSKRSHRSVISATDHLSHIAPLIQSINTQSEELKNGLPALESAATTFAQKYDRNTENAVLDRRKKAMLLSRNVDRVGDILDLPTLLSTTISTSASAATQGTSATTATGYASALDLHAHVKRLKSLYPESGLVEDIAKQSDNEIQNLITVLITGLQNPSLKLAGAMRMIGWLRRVAPELAEDGLKGQNKSRGFGATMGEGSLGALFLVCRLSTLRRTLEALEPLRDLADQETARRDTMSKGPGWTGGAQTERYLKRYIEVFREQSFAIISMYKSIFPTALPVPGSTGGEVTSPSISSPQALRLPTLTSMNDMARGSSATDQPLGNMPSALATFAPHLVDMLSQTLRLYLPNIYERTSRDSLLTQVLYCAGSLGRLGADFGMMLALLEDEMRGNIGEEETQDEQDREWVQIMKKHRVQASRLELLASGVGSGRKGSTAVEIRSPLSPSAT